MHEKELSLYWDEFIPLWSSFSDTRTLRKDLCLVWRLCPGNLPALMHEAVGLQFWTRWSHRDWIYLSTWNNYKKKRKEKMKYDFQTLGRQHKIVIPEMRKQVTWALWMPHLIPSKVSRLQLRKEQLKRHWCSPWVFSFATCRVDQVKLKIGSCTWRTRKKKKKERGRPVLTGRWHF